MIFPSALKATLSMLPRCSMGMPSGFQLSASHRWTLPSAPPVTIVRPSGLKAAARISVACFTGGPSGWPVVASQSRVVVSRLPVTTFLLSGLKAIPQTSPPCCSRSPIGWPVAVSQSRAFFPSGLSLNSCAPLSRVLPSVAQGHAPDFFAVRRSRLEELPGRNVPLGEDLFLALGRPEGLAVRHEGQPNDPAICALAWGKSRWCVSRWPRPTGRSGKPYCRSPRSYCRD